MNKQTLNNYLMKHKEKNISILGFIENYPISKIFKEGDTILILGDSDYLWAYISSDNKKEIKRIMEKFNFETKYFASLENWMIPIITKDKEIDWKLSTYRFILPKNVKIDSLDYPVRKLSISDANYIYDNSTYKEFTSVDYINERIKKGVSVGISKNNELVGWGLTHDDGALGFLHVIPKFRGKGYGKNIVKALIKKKRELGKSVFLNVEAQNIKAKSLYTNLGFLLDREISWVKVK